MATSMIQKKVNIEEISLAERATLYRIGNMRMLVLNGYSGSGTSLHLDSDDAPSSAVTAPAFITGSTGLSDRVGQITVGNTSPYYVRRYYAGTYNSSTAGLLEVSSTDKTIAVAVWSV